MHILRNVLQISQNIFIWMLSSISSFIPLQIYGELPSLESKNQETRIGSYWHSFGWEFFLFLAWVDIIFILSEFILLFWGPLEGKLRKKTRSLKVMTQVRVFTPSFSMCVETRREERSQANAVRETSKCSPRAAGSGGQRGVMRFLAET